VVLGRVIPWLRTRHDDRDRSAGNSIPAAFPGRLRSDAVALVEALPAATFQLARTYTVTTAAESVTIPERIYNPEPKSLRTLNDMQHLMLHCLYSRHHDGFVRQRHLRGILGSREDWVAPFVVRLIGEYVLPIVQDIQAALAADPVERARLRRFANENPAFVDLTRQRAVSYWNAYYRYDYPRAADYPGITALEEVRSTRPSECL
jgi:hypothetical protein